MSSQFTIVWFILNNMVTCWTRSWYLAFSICDADKNINRILFLIKNEKKKKVICEFNLCPYIVTNHWKWLMPLLRLPLCPAFLLMWCFQIWGRPWSTLWTRDQTKGRTSPPDLQGQCHWDSRSEYLNKSIRIKSNYTQLLTGYTV